VTDQLPLVPFLLLAGAAVGGALGMVLARNVVHAAFWLLEVMLAVAGLFLLMSAEFLALVQVMVYAGAVSVLMLFTIMLTLRRRDDAKRPRDLSMAALVLALLFGLAVFFAVSGFDPSPGVMPAAAPGIEAFGRLLFTKWALPFEIASVLLLIALVGAVWWGGGDEER